MIVYSATKKIFSDDVVDGTIADKIQNRLKQSLGHFAHKGIERTFYNSLPYMHIVLSDSEIPDDSGVSIEYKIPQTGKQIDFIISGKDERSRDNVVIIELKQWESAEISEKDGIVSTFVGGRIQEVNHPSYQAWAYAALLEDFNETIRNDNVLLKPCAYLHNYRKDDVITNSFYDEYLQKAPAFLKSDALKLREFIKRYVKHGDSNEIMYRIDHGRIRPSKSLADKLSSLLQGNQEFIMIDDQKVVYESAIALVRKAKSKSKQVLIVEGGPGTGKSVVAINLLVALINKQKNVQYVTKNAAPRAVYESKLAGTLRRTRIANLFCGSGAYTDCAPNTFDALIVDEAHRLNRKSGMFQNQGENQIKEIIRSAKCSIFFIDEDQRVTLKDIGKKEEILRWAKLLGAVVQQKELSSQFRCNGSDGYLAWLDNTLQIRKTANTILDARTYDFKILSSPNELRDLIYEKNKINNKARLVAGYCWDWASKKDSSLNDVQILKHKFEMRWNLADDGSLWILKPKSVKEIGCIHTCQGLELDYVGVIIGEDLVYRDERIVTDPTKRAKTDASIKGYKRLLKENPTQAAAKMDMIIKNTYKTLLTRAMKGCYVYCVDEKLEDYLRKCLQAPESKEEKPLLFSDLVTPEEEKLLAIETDVNQQLKYKEYLPVYSLQAAAGKFLENTNVHEKGWVKVDLKRKLTETMFIAQVVGKSMEPTIKDGSWCLFRPDQGGSRNGKVVLVECRKLIDPETASSYTIKRYFSEKSGTDSFHKKITLKPDNKDFKDIVLENVQDSDFHVVAEFVEVLK